MTNVEEYGAQVMASIDFTAHLNTLVKAWTDVGEPAESQRGFIDDLRTSIGSVLQHSVEEATKRKNDLEILVERKSETVAALKRELSGATDTNTDAFTLPDDSLTLIQRLNSLETVEASLTKLRSEWVDKLSAKRDQAAGMCQMLGLTFDEKLQDIGSLTPQRLKAYDNYIEVLTQTKSERKQIIADSKASILQFWQILETVPTTHLEKSIADETCDLGVHVEVIEALQQMKADLNIEYQNRETETAELGAEIQHLWDLLQIDEKFQQYFSDKNGGIGLRAVEACRDERQRLLIKKEKLLPRIIGHERNEISKLFDQTSCDKDSQVKLFPAFHSPPEQQNEEYLNTLKTYTARLEKRFEGLQPILNRIERRKVLVEERVKYQALISDPNRLTSRDRGLSQLKENEMRIRVEKKLPKLENSIKELITKWETDNESVLVLENTPYLATMLAEQKAYQEMVEQRKQHRSEVLKNKKQGENASSSWKRGKRGLNKTGRRKPGRSTASNGPENTSVPTSVATVR